MRKLSYILSLILILSAVMQSVCVADTKPQTAYGEKANIAVGLLEALDITAPSGEYDNDAARGEFLNVLMQLLKAPRSYSGTLPFKDITEDDIPLGYLDAALSTGIISAADSFEPARAVTYSEAAKMAVVALGYAGEAAAMGGYPYGYISQAQRLRLFDKVSAKQNESLKLGDMYILFGNLCEADLRLQISYGNKYSFETANGVNILTHYFKLLPIEGIIEANEHTSLYDPNVKSYEGCITVDNVKYNYSGSILPGTNIKAWAKETGSTDTVIYAYPENNTIITVNGNDITRVDGNKVYYTNTSGKEISIRTASLPAILYNNQASAKIGSLSGLDLSGSEITFIDNNKSGDYDVISIMQSRSFVVSGTNVYLGKIYDQNAENTVSTDNSDIIYAIYVNGEKAELKDIKAQSVADVYISESEELCTVKISSESIGGTIGGFDSALKVIYVNDKPYIYNDYFEKYYINKVKIGKNITLLLNGNGEVTAIESAPPVSMIYGYYLQSKKSGGLSEEVQIRVFTQNGKYETLTLDDKLTVDCISAVTAAQTIDNYLTEEQLIRYSLNSDKKINKIDTMYSNSDRAAGSAEPTVGFVTDSMSPDDNLTRYSFPYEDSSTTMYFKYNSMHPHFALSADSIIFTVDTTRPLSDEKRCSITTRASFTNDQRFSSNCVRPYNVSENGIAEVMINYTTAASESNMNESGVVQSFTRAVTPDGEFAVKVVLYCNGNIVKTLYITDSEIYAGEYTDENIQNGEFPIGPGDYIRYTSNSSGTITALKKDYDFSSKKIISGNAGANSERNYYAGYMYSCDTVESMLFLSLTNEREDIETAQKLSVFTWGSACIFDIESDMIYPARLSDIVTYTMDTDNCDYVFFHSGWATGKLLVIYR